MPAGWHGMLRGLGAWSRERAGEFKCGRARLGDAGSPAFGLTDWSFDDSLTLMSDLLARITIDPAQMHGRPCVRGLRMTVADVLGLLSAGQSRDAILRDYPYLESADIDAVLALNVVY